MNSPSGPVTLPGGGRLHARRCARHSAREAAARCPGCGEFFCRECVVEHQGKLLCAECIARAVVQGGRRQERRTALRRGAATAGGGLVLWLLFYGVGALLLQVPPNFHDGTIWKKFVERTGP